MLTSRTILLSGAIAGGTAVALGAFGAHALRPVLEAQQGTDIYALAAQYQFFHALTLLLIGVLAERHSSSRLGWAAWCMNAGIILFCGSLYVLALTGSRSVVLMTPLGGVFFLAGWILLVIDTWIGRSVK
jgi:uncharacterized membrane protein YgdD (TMEM256/DUF423 family)